MAFNLLLVIILLTLHCCCLYNAQELVGSGTDLCDKNENCYKVANCIKTYHGLDLYVRGNSELKENLTSGFFVTGEIPSDFVKIIYNFQVSNPVPVYT